MAAVMPRAATMAGAVSYTPLDVYKRQPMHFTGRSFDRGGRVGQKVVSTMITALVGGFLVLLNSHGKPHVYKTSDITSGLQDGTR